jgi:putative flippase GtrA
MIFDISRILSPARKELLFQFLRFGTVGFVGFVTDTSIIYALRGWLGLYGAGTASYAAAATVTWGLNRLWTFRGQGQGRAIHHQWALFLAANGVGFLLNRGAYFTLVTISPLCAAHPVLAVLGGVGFGMFINFYMSRQLVFR